MKIFVMLILVFAAVSAHATCAQSDMTGTWYATGMSADLAFSEADATFGCKLRVASTGAVINSGSACEVRDGASKHIADIVAGNLKVWPGCGVTGYFSVCELGSCEPISIDWMRMDRDKTIMGGAMRVYHEPSSVLFLQAVKY